VVVFELAAAAQQAEGVHVENLCGKGVSQSTALPALADDATLFSVATDPLAVNRRAAEHELKKRGDRLHVLHYLLAHVVGPCASHIEDATRAPATDDTDTGAVPLLTLAVCNARALYAYNEAILCQMQTHMLGTDPLVFEQVRMWNALAWTCPHMPAVLGALIFWWLATAHHGVFDMVLTTETAHSWWRFEGRFDMLRDIVEAYVVDVANSDVHATLALAANRLGVLAYMVLFRDEALMRIESMPRVACITKDSKEHIRAHMPAAKRTTKDLPPVSVDATMANSS